VVQHVIVMVQALNHMSSESSWLAWYVRSLTPQMLGHSWSGTNKQSALDTHKARSGQVRSGQVRSGQVRSGQVRSSQ